MSESVEAERRWRAAQNHPKDEFRIAWKLTLYAPEQVGPPENEELVPAATFDKLREALELVALGDWIEDDPLAVRDMARRALGDRP